MGYYEDKVNELSLGKYYGASGGSGLETPQEYETRIERVAKRIIQKHAPRYIKHTPNLDTKDKEI